MGEIPRLCLNMIVKNESSIIERLLESVVPYIDTYCICDTGSTDNTIDKIEKFFTSRSIQGVICSEPFRDFGYNRTVALKRCLKMNNVDYILLLDADMMLSVNEMIPPESFKRHLLKADAFHVMQGTQELQYQNIRIVKKTEDLHYWGVTHEYIVLPKDANVKPLLKNQVFIQDIGDGGSKHDKFSRDIKLLQKGLEEHPGNSRYLFYLANSYKNNNQLNEAIETYLKRIDAKDWIEEVWYSYYAIGHCYYLLRDFPKAIYYWLEGYQVHPCRVENLYQIVHHYRTCEKYELAYSFYLLAKRMLEKHTDHNHLFMENDIYVYKLDYEYSIMAYYCKCKKTDVAKTSMALLDYLHLPESISKNVISNYKYYAKSLIKMANDSHHELFTCFAACTPFIEGFKPTLPSICKLDDTNYILNIRYINSETNENQIIRNIISHITHTDKWTPMSCNELIYDTSSENGLQPGMDDLRLFPLSSGIAYTCKRRTLADSNIRVEMGYMNPISHKVYNSGILQNTLPASNIGHDLVFSPSINDDTLPVISAWHPLTLGKIENNEFVGTHIVHTPHFFQNIHSSCHGVRVEDEYWFLCHIVSHESVDYHYHFFVILDASTYAYKKHTHMYTFEKEPIESCIGINYEPTGNFIIGYTLNHNTRFISVAKSNFA
jgi:tetratricopeptide (TPR) repeat protein